MDIETLANIRKRVAALGNERAVILPSGDIVATGEPEEIERVWRANLLIRSKDFREELARVYKAVMARRKDRDKLMFSKTWREFCYSWQIHHLWDGSPAKLHYYTSSGAEFFFKEQSGKIYSVPFESVMWRGGEHIFPLRSTRWPEGVHKEPSFIYLKLTPQTGIEDVARMWQIAESLKKQVWKTSERKKRTFSRDLMFFDLHRYPLFGPLTYGQIAQRQKMSKAGVQLACDRILESINRRARSPI